MKRHGQLVGLLLTVFVLGVLVDSGTDARAADTASKSAEAQVLPDFAAGAARTATALFCKEKQIVSWGDRQPLHQQSQKWCGACRNQHKRWVKTLAQPNWSTAATAAAMHLDSDGGTAGASQTSAGPVAGSSDLPVPAEAFAAQTAADSSTRISVLSPGRLRKQAENLAEESKRVKKARRAVEEKNTLLQRDNDTLRQHIDDLETVNDQAAFLRDVGKVNNHMAKEGFKRKHFSVWQGSSTFAELQKEDAGLHLLCETTMCKASDVRGAVRGVVRRARGTQTSRWATGGSERSESGDF
eukprot:CAMPEP_0181326048 /NCGR_PEP_ID=MMETSP1101-20121128/21272_1 /TAXON_ID=46948 /ORGANISM="Rhodomonas abbreviata, Strain Caron Lab Isolate" /LENGTH=297 /DNA_ID=CAMNT_0023434439 /DNA_START=88 /DNA_END=983 /DNA_ORIENTATION=-